MSDLDVPAFVQQVLGRVADLAADRARPLIPSETLAEALRIVAGDEPSTVFLEIPHYWAVYVHDGRGSFGPRRAEWLVWFRDKLMDPRTNFGTHYPIREADIQRLSKEQFQYGLELNRQARARGERVPMIVAKFQPRIMQGVPFFSDGLAEFSSEAAPLIKEEFESFLESVRPDDETDTASLSL